MMCLDYVKGIGKRESAEEWHESELNLYRNKLSFQLIYSCFDHVMLVDIHHVKYIQLTML